MKTIKKRLPIVWRMTITNMLIVFFLIMLFIVGFITALFYEISSAKENKLEAAIKSVEDKLEQEDDFSEEYLRSIKLRSGLNYALYTSDSMCLYTTVKDIPAPNLEPMNAQIRFNGEDPIHGENPEEYEFVIQSGKWIKDGSLYLYVFGDITDDIEIVEKTPFLIAGTLLAGLLISFFVGRFMSGVMLRPVKKISLQMKTISASNLNERLIEIASQDELQELSHSFNLMIDRIEKAFEKQKQFVSDASHELRTPLAVIQGHTAMLRRWGKEDKATLDNSLETIHNEIRGMVELIDRLLTLAKSESTSSLLHKESIKVCPFLQEIVDEIRLISPNAHITLHCGKDTVYADRPALKQVLRILLGNSIKFCLPPGEIKLETVSKDGGTLMTVSDEGIGIESEKLPFVFDRFFCADSSRTRKTNGTGLGLAIAKSIIDTHRGTIDIKSEPGKGTKVFVWLKDDTV